MCVAVFATVAPADIAGDAMKCVLVETMAKKGSSNRDEAVALVAAAESTRSTGKGFFVSC